MDYDQSDETDLFERLTSDKEFAEQMIQEHGSPGFRAEWDALQAQKEILRILGKYSPGVEETPNKANALAATIVFEEMKIQPSEYRQMPLCERLEFLQLAIRKKEMSASHSLPNERHKDSEAPKQDNTVLEDGPTENGICLGGVNYKLTSRAKQIVDAVWKCQDRSLTFLDAEDVTGTQISKDSAKRVQRNFNDALTGSSWEMSLANEAFTIKKSRKLNSASDRHQTGTAWFLFSVQRHSLNARFLNAHYTTVERTAASDLRCG